MIISTLLVFNYYSTHMEADSTVRHQQKDRCKNKIL
jgi:hypothetical protein